MQKAVESPHWSKILAGAEEKCGEKGAAEMKCYEVTIVPIPYLAYVSHGQGEGRDGENEGMKLSFVRRQALERC